MRIAGTAPLEPGPNVTLTVFPRYPDNPQLTRCGGSGPAAAALPRVAPGKSKAVRVAGLVAPDEGYAQLTVGYAPGTTGRALGCSNSWPFACYNWRLT